MLSAKRRRRCSITFTYSCWFLFSICGTHTLFGQELKRTAFSFLNVGSSARVSGLGGVNVSLTDRDPNLFLSNPSLVSDSLSGYASLNYQFYIADVGHAAFTYLPTFNRIGTIAIAVDHFSYGSMDGYDATGAPLENFSISETALVLSRSHQIANFRLGGSFKAAFSSLAGYRASALMLDLGGVFVHPDQRFQLGLVVKNLGFVVKDYTETSGSALPVDVQIGATFKPEHMPFRFSVTAYRLVQSKAVEYDQALQTAPSGLDKVLRHFNFATEILLHRSVNVLVGYNYGIHQELKIENAGGSAGLTFGFSARIKAVEFVFSRSSFVAGNAGYAFTLSSDLKQIFRR